MTWFLANLGLVWDLTLAHIALSVPPIVIGFLLSLPLGWVANRYRVTRGVLLTVGGVLYTVPSIALFVVLPVVLGTSIYDPANVVVALTIYALALMLRVTADGLASVPGDITQSARAMGFSGWQRFWRVDFPLAGPVLLAGLRVISVSTVSLVSVGSVIGVTSLGYLFINGYQRAIVPEVVSGIIATLVIALTFDVVLVIAGRLLMPWNRRRGRSA